MQRSLPMHSQSGGPAWRIVDLGAVAEHLLAVGVTPIGAVTRAYPAVRPGYLERALARTRPLGQVDRPLLDLLPSLRPDLIVGRSHVADHLAALQRIAPTVILDLPTHQWRDLLLAVGEVVGRKDRAQQWLADYDRDAAVLRERIALRLAESASAVLRVRPRELTLYGRHGLGGILFDDLKLTADLLSPHLRTPPDPWTAPLQIEEIGSLTAEHLYITVDEGRAAAARFEELKASAAWNELPAVKLQQVYHLDQQWFFGSMEPLGKRLMLKQLAMTFIR
jgi:iron complex transport system substrate-binding protein